MEEGADWFPAHLAAAAPKASGDRYFSLIFRLVLPFTGDDRGGEWGWCWGSRGTEPGGASTLGSPVGCIPYVGTTDPHSPAGIVPGHRDACHANAGALLASASCRSSWPQSHGHPVPGTQHGTSIPTSAGVILHQELIQRNPAPADPHHQGAAQDPHHPQLLGLPELRGRGVSGQGEGASGLRQGWEPGRGTRAGTSA